MSNFFRIKHIIKFSILLTCLLAFQDIFSQDRYVIELLPFNSRQSDEFGPSFYKDGIIFCSNRKNDFIINYTDQNEKPLLDIYYSAHKDSVIWSRAKILDNSLVTVFHDGPACACSDQNIIYFTRNNNIKIKKFDNSIDPDNKLGIYVAINTGAGWDSITAFIHNKPESNFAHPCICNNNTKLFFISDIQGGHGGTDIYVCDLENGKWGSPKNLGSVINTSGNEVFPYYHPGGRLYFASDRHKSTGGLDIFYTFMEDGKWQKPVRLDEPFNSKSDDFGYISDDPEETGYFCSNRNGTDDIYFFRSTFPHFGTCPEYEENDYCYVFYETSNYNLDTIPMVYEWDLGDGTKERGLEVEHCFSGPGEYKIQLNVIDTITGEVYFNQAAYDFLIEDIEQVYITASDTCYAGSEIRFDGKKTNIKDLTVENWFWDFGDSNRSVGPAVTHTYRKPGEYTIMLGVTGIVENEIKKACSVKNIVVIKKK